MTSSTAESRRDVRVIASVADAVSAIVYSCAYAVNRTDAPRRVEAVTIGSWSRKESVREPGRCKKNYRGLARGLLTCRTTSMRLREALANGTTIVCNTDADDDVCRSV